MSRETPLSAVLAELDKQSIDYEILKSKHQKVVFYVKGRKCIYAAASSHSDHRAIKNARSEVRKIIRTRIEEAENA